MERVAREVAERLTRRGAVIGHEPATRADRGVQRSDVRVAEQRTRSPAERIVVEMGEQAHRAVASAHAQDRVHGVVSKRGIQVAQSLGIAPTEVVVASEHVVAHGRPVRSQGDGDGGGLGGQGGRRQEEQCGKPAPHRRILFFRCSKNASSVLM